MKNSTPYIAYIDCETKGYKNQPVCTHKLEKIGILIAKRDEHQDIEIKLAKDYPILNDKGVCVKLKDMPSSCFDKINGEYEESKKENNISFVCGHNFINHDNKYLKYIKIYKDEIIIDTYYLSMLLFPTKINHQLEKPYKVEINTENFPLADCKQTCGLLALLDKKFEELDDVLKSIFVSYLYDKKYFQGYFEYRRCFDNKSATNQKISKDDVYDYITITLNIPIFCNKEQLDKYLDKYPEACMLTLSYLSISSSETRTAVSSAVLYNFPEIVEIIKAMFFDEQELQKQVLPLADSVFSFKSFKEYEPAINDSSTKIQQKEIIKTAIGNKSLIAVLPTGGGKTFTFQLPALLCAQAYKGLTVVISPLQALMQDQVRVFKKKNTIYKVATYSSYLTEIDRINALKKTKRGEIDILYLAPEALKSKKVMKTLESRIIARFVIDEAHCFSKWGHDFRHAYYFIAKRIRILESNKHQSKIPLSCFTATATQEVIADMKKYLKEELDIKDVREFIASSIRKEIKYRAIFIEADNYKDEKSKKEDIEKKKYEKLKEIILNDNNKPTIIYRPQNAAGCKELAKKLKKEHDPKYEQLKNLNIEPFYADLDKDRKSTKALAEADPQQKSKEDILTGFINNEINIIVATTAFGMGIDKPDITRIIHYDLSDSLASYMQESGRGARDQGLEAECIILYSNLDIDYMFERLKVSTIDYSKLQRIYEVIKENAENNLVSITGKKLKKGLFDNEKREAANQKLETCLLELEKWGVIERQDDEFRAYNISFKDNKKITMQEVQNILGNKSDYLDLKSGINYYSFMIEIMQNVIQKSKTDQINVDELANILGLTEYFVTKSLDCLKKKELLVVNHDIEMKFLSANKKIITDKSYKLLGYLKEQLDSSTCQKFVMHYREINNNLNENDNPISKDELRDVLEWWNTIFRIHNSSTTIGIYDEDFVLKTSESKGLKTNLEIIHNTLLYRDAIIGNITAKLDDENIINFEAMQLYLELKKEEKYSHYPMDMLYSCLDNIEEINNMTSNRGRTVFYNKYNLLLKTTDKKQLKNYTMSNYKEGLLKHYSRKIGFFHMFQSFLEKLSENENTSSFISDYFTMPKEDFIDEYCPEKRVLIKPALPITLERYNLIYDLNEEQKKVLKECESPVLCIAGPGSGKTKMLVHKIASMLTIEKNNPSCFLMLAHSRSAVREFKERLVKLVEEKIVKNLKILTFHSYAYELLNANLDSKSEKFSLDFVLTAARLYLEKTETKVQNIKLLVVDEFQDVSEQMYLFLIELYSKMNPVKKQIIVVGDDDQCINNFEKNRADSIFMEKYKNDFIFVKEVDPPEQNEDDALGLNKSDQATKKVEVKQYYLRKNYRSKKNIVDFAKLYCNKNISNRLKNVKNDIKAIQKEKGSITITKYSTPSASDQLLQDVLQDKSKSTDIAILAWTNEEVLNIYSTLCKKNIPNLKLSILMGKMDEKYGLGLMIELREFLKLWKDKNYSFKIAKSKILNWYQESRNRELIEEIITNFEEDHELELIEEHKERYVKKFEYYLNIINHRDFLQHKNQDIFTKKRRIVVSTMHMAKGREFQTVYMYVNDKFDVNKYNTRLLYVAMTRAKENLHIHIVENKYKILFDTIEKEINDMNVKVNKYNSEAKSPDPIVLVIGLGDLNLGEIINKKKKESVHDPRRKIYNEYNKDKKLFYPDTRLDLRKSHIYNNYLYKNYIFTYNNVPIAGVADEMCKKLDDINENYDFEEARVYQAVQYPNKIKFNKRRSELEKGGICILPKVYMKKKSSNTIESTT